MNRNGKIARLPLSVRNQLNQKLQNGQDGPEVLAWLNELPETKEMLKNHFDGVPVSPQNLSEWRSGGYREWEVRQELLGHLEDVAEGDEEMGNLLVEKLLKTVTLKYAQLLAKWDGELTEDFQAKMKVLGKLTRDIALLQRATHQAVKRRNDWREKEGERVAERNRLLMHSPWKLADRGENWGEIKREVKVLLEKRGSIKDEPAENQTKSNQIGTSNIQHSTSNLEQEKIKPNQTTEPA